MGMKRESLLKRLVKTFRIRPKLVNCVAYKPKDALAALIMQQVIVD